MHHGLSLHQIVFEIDRRKAPAVLYNWNNKILLNLALLGLAQGAAGAAEALPGGIKAFR